MLLRCKTDVDAAAETVFACVDEPEHIVKWVGGAVSHTYVTERDPTNPVGQRFLQKLRMGALGQRLRWRGHRLGSADDTSACAFRRRPILAKLTSE